MTIVDEKEILEIEKIKLEVQKLLDEPIRLKIDIYRTMLLTITVTTAVVSAYFKFLAE